jgi:endonuclease/exonuclease/phosphatase family metal-dependent hydrolase
MSSCQRAARAVGVVRVVTLNLWGDQGPHAQRFPLVVQGLRELDADVICLQEVRQVPDRVPNQAEELAAALGFHWVFEPASSWGGGDEGLAVVSRFPVQQRAVMDLPESTSAERRLVLMAAVRPPGVGAEEAGGLIRLFTTHLHYRPTDGGRREAQVLAVDEFVNAHRQDADGAVLVTGDFNATDSHDEIRFLRGFHTLGGQRTYYQDAYVAANPTAGPVDGATWARRNHFTRKLHWLEADRRIDYIFVGAMRRDGRNTVHSSAVVLDTADAHGLFPSDHFGVMADVAYLPTAEQVA